MPNFTRKNAWNQGGTFDNPDLLWYAKGVGVLQSRSLDDPNSWWFFGAIHGVYLKALDPDIPSMYFWSNILSPPSVPTTPLPSKSLQDTFWKQCQHQSWFFPPWHRGYLIAIEAQVRQAIIDLGGPENWSMPYWNYFGPDDQYKIPPAFMEKTLPDSTPNPLYVVARYGPNNDGNVYVDTTKVSQQNQKNTLYTGSNANTQSPGYGGPDTGFWHGGTHPSGNLESNPHNTVHTLVGGIKGNSPGLMAYPGLAALDPVFYLHHANIDRMWASWNANGNTNPTDANWLKGPAAVGEREFAMPMPDGSTWNFTPEDVSDLSKLNYTYEDLSTLKSVTLEKAVARRLQKLGVSPTDSLTAQNMALGKNAELIGAHDKPLSLGGSGLQTTVKLDSSAKKKVNEGFLKASALNIPDKVYLQLEHVTGTLDANILTVSVNQKLAGHVSLFGLMEASAEGGHHGGSGLTLNLEITHIIDELHLDEEFDADALDVTVIPNNIPENESITVGKISVYREQQQ
ncbi:tyrosinase family protein [Marinoscillum furvescens]|uniref:Tyrosinase n=1 Tax=Marinoscillum furvescens DSM 4134 TaxID=1122208 RepID=A0A3D9L5Y2_MARFU|nr:tyrosinase family protein [Marinoscillum furvescens]REE00126.1 tyrosinase [Marinoscillum furvescens DSM 4134]